MTNREGVACEIQVWVLGCFGSWQGRAGRSWWMSPAVRISACFLPCGNSHRCAQSSLSRAFSCQNRFFGVTGSR